MTSPEKKRLRVGSRISVPDRTPRVTKVSSKSKDVQDAPAAPSATVTSATTSQDGLSKFYIVQSGDSLFSIAMKYNTTVDSLKKLNSIRRGRVLKVGAKIRLPENVNAGDSKDGQSKNQNSQDSTQRKINKNKKNQAVAKNAKRAQKRQPAQKLAKTAKPVKKNYHIVRRGENLEKIANRYAVDMTEFKSKNKLKNSSRILVGQRLLIPNVN